VRALGAQISLRITHSRIAIILGNFLVDNLPTGYSLVYLPTELDLIPTPIPEPASWIGGALTLGAIGFVARRRLVKS
jgi:PEP-CTERM motif